MRFKTIVALCLLSASAVSAQELKFSYAKFSIGDNETWKQLNFDDSSWKTLQTFNTWNSQGISSSAGFGWYRMKKVFPKSMLTNSNLRDSVVFSLAKIDDVDETYLNGKLIGHTGSMPQQEGGYMSAYSNDRIYKIAANDPIIKWDQENIIAVRVYDGGGSAGIYGDTVRVYVPDFIDGMKIGFRQKSIDKKAVCAIDLRNEIAHVQKGSVSITVFDLELNKPIQTIGKNLTVGKLGSKSIDVTYPKNHCVNIKITYRDQISGKTMTKNYVPKYILTPVAAATPCINNAMCYGVRPGSPVIYRIPATGVRPMKFAVKDLPEGLTLDADKGVISGSLAQQGSYVMTLMAENAKGKDAKTFTIKVGQDIALTPPMGWNSWNCWGLSVSQEKVMSSAKALIDKGLADYGYSYVNIDDAWEAAQRNADGTISPNEKFPDMKGLGDWLHSNGLKFGIYSSPGDLTCGGYLGTLDHEEQDAKVYNSWGVDYLKYDWCGYGRKYDKEGDRTVAAFIRPYILMEQYLRAQPRDIFYSLCQYGMGDVWKWGKFVDANSWRTTGDITDTWESMSEIGFNAQAYLYPYSSPGHWNDPDMLVVGKVGWGPSLHDTRLTPDEQYTHISLWSLLAANMLIGCDLSQIDEFTLNLLENNEVNAVNQDALGAQAHRDIVDGNIQVWKRRLYDGSYAVGIFNLGAEPTKVDFGAYAKRLNLKNMRTLRDLWRQKNLDINATEYMIPSHGVKFLKVTE